MFENSDKKLQQLKVNKQAAAERLANSLKKHDISYCPTDGDLENVVFSKGNDNYKIAQELFFRLSGKCVIWEVNKKGERIIPLPDSEFYGWIRMFILAHFKIEE